MKRKEMLGVAAVVVALMLAAEGARMMKSKEDEEKNSSYQPQNFIVGGGFIPSTPGTPGFATGFGFGPSGFCSFPGSCTNNVPGAVVPTIPGGSSGGGGVGSHSQP